MTTATALRSRHLLGIAGLEPEEIELIRRMAQFNDVLEECVRELENRPDAIICFSGTIVIDEVGYIPFEPEAANLFFQLISARYERASVIVTSNKPFGRWGETFGDDTVAAAMIDRLVHHAEVVALKGDSYRLKDRDLGRVPGSTTEET